MKMLFTRFPLESSYGGAEVQTLTLMKGLREKGHEILFLSSCPVLLERTKELGIKNQELRIGSPPVTKWGAVSFLWRKRRMRRKLVEAMCHGEVRGACPPLEAHPSTSSRFAPRDDTQRASNHDTIIFMLSLSEKLLLTDWAVKHGIKVFWIEHDRVGRWLTMNPWLPKLRKLSTLATTIVVSDLSRDLYRKLGWNPQKVISIPNGIDIERFANAQPKTYNLTPNIFRIGCIARLTRDKGVDLLIEAISDLPNIALTIVGTGKEEENIHTLINRANQPFEALNGKTSKRINLLPTVDPKNFYHSIDALVLPSREHDPFGLVAAEAMASGVPVIVTDACGIAPCLTNDEDALIVPAGNTLALRNAIKTLQEFSQLRKKLAERGPIIARERFSSERMVREYEKLLVSS